MAPKKSPPKRGSNATLSDAASSSGGVQPEIIRLMSEDEECTPLLCDASSSSSGAQLDTSRFVSEDEVRKETLQKVAAKKKEVVRKHIDTVGLLCEMNG